MFSKYNYNFFSLSKDKIFIIILLLIISSCKITKVSELTPKENKAEVLDFKCVFYNCENLFDIIDDTLTNDDEYLSFNPKNWDTIKYNEKLNHVSEIITEIGQGKFPAIVGLCEVENRQVLEDLINKPNLISANYKIVHFDSQDYRGMDVALLYDSNIFFPINSSSLPVCLAAELNAFKTRDILYVKGLINGIFIHVFVNHWPSQWAGKVETEKSRFAAAAVLRNAIDSIFITEPHANILIIGDFNDTPLDLSITEVLQVKNDFSEISEENLYNLSYYSFANYGSWSYKELGEYKIIDQTIVSGNLLNPKNPVYLNLYDMHVYNNEKLLQPDTVYGGYKPFNTYQFNNYARGYSDHLPVFLHFKNNYTFVNILKSNILKKKVLKNNYN